jgi:hypothetical protein
MLLYRSDTNKFFLLIDMYYIYNTVDSVKSYCYFYLTYQQFNRIDSVMVSVLASGLLDREFEDQSDQNKSYNIGIRCFSAKHTPIRRESKYWLARTQYVSEWSDMSTRGLLFQ